MENLTVDLPVNAQLNDNEHLNRAPAIFCNEEILYLPIENIHLEYEDQ